MAQTAEEQLRDAKNQYDVAQGEKKTAGIKAGAATNVLRAMVAAHPDLAKQMGIEAPAKMNKGPKAAAETPAATAAAATPAPAADASKGNGSKVASASAEKSK